jgi:FkbM family methyltransferase
VRPDWIHVDAVILSVGLGSDVSFDLEIIRRFGCLVHAFDPTPKSAEWLRQQALPPQFRYYELGLADYDGEAHFALPEARPDWDCYVASAPDATTAADSHSGQVRRLETLADLVGTTRIDVLKMDIEGNEYDVISDMLAGDIRPRQLLFESHHRREFRENLPRARETVAALQDAGYRIFARSARGLEFSMCFAPNQ